jgi:hypothetical protein
MKGHADLISNVAKLLTLYSFRMKPHCCPVSLQSPVNAVASFASTATTHTLSNHELIKNGRIAFHPNVSGGHSQATSRWNNFSIGSRPTSLFFGPLTSCRAYTMKDVEISIHSWAPDGHLQVRCLPSWIFVVLHLRCQVRCSHSWLVHVYYPSSWGQRRTDRHPG